MERNVAPLIVGSPHPAEAIRVIPMPATIGAEAALYPSWLPRIPPSGMVNPLPIRGERVVKIAEADPKIALRGGRQCGRDQRNRAQGQSGRKQFDGEFAGHVALPWSSASKAPLMRKRRPRASVPVGSKPFSGVLGPMRRRWPKRPSLSGLPRARRREPRRAIPARLRREPRRAAPWRGDLRCVTPRC